jgi:predicted metal-dependent hydrolase
MKTPWFSVNKEGLSKILERKGKTFLLLELIQNAWDQNVSTVKVQINPIKNSQKIEFIVEDDDPNGFQDLSHAYTLFAESNKKNNPEKRGRFNLGEKLVLALCESASIKTTTGTIVFDQNGRSKKKEKTQSGSIFKGIIKISKQDLNEIIENIQWIIPPINVKTIIQNQIIQRPRQIQSCMAVLQTEIADSEGRLKKTQRKTLIEIFPKNQNNQAYIYEMGIPVVETDIGFNINVNQKIPLSMERDNVQPSYSRKLKAIVLNLLAESLNENQLAEKWIDHAFEDENCSPKTIQTIIKKRHGEKTAVFDPTDPESKHRATAKGFNVIHGNSYSKKAWINIRNAGGIPSASQIAPSPKPFDKNGNPLNIIPQELYTENLIQINSFCQIFAIYTIQQNIEIKFTKDRQWNFKGAFGKNKILYINLVFVKPIINQEFIEFLIHELAHFTQENHLSDEFHQECCKIGATWGWEKEAIFEEFNKKIGNTAIFA